jgi:GDPmannose 4,6-dehydratase
MLVTQPDLKPGGVFNIGGNYTATVKSILEYLLSISQVKNIQILSDPARFRPIDANLQIPDTTRFITLTGWKPLYTFEQTMHDLLNYWRCQISRNGQEFLSR